MKSVVAGRRNCSKCKRFKHLVFFGPRRWCDKDKTVVKYVHSECDVCRREADREKRIPAAERDPAHAYRIRSRDRAFKRKQRRQAGVPEIGPRVRNRRKSGSVPREPFARWLDEMVTNRGISAAAESTGIRPERIRRFIQGYEMTGRHMGSPTKRKLRSIDWVSIGVVDDAGTAAGDPGLLDRLYPYEDE